MPRAKRAKQYRRLMKEMEMGFGFRIPYQCLIDAELLAEATRCKIPLVKALEQTFGVKEGQVKPMITQCSMRHLYKEANPGAIDQAKEFERRRCGHHPDEFPEPLSTLECLRSVVDPKGQNSNKFRYCVASNDLETRAALRQVKGVPLIYISRSVMIMEPMSSITVNERSREERAKLRAEIKKPAKRKRDDDDDDDDRNINDNTRQTGRIDKPVGPETKKKKKKAHGPKGPNPLSVKKAKKSTPAPVPASATA